MPTRNGMEPCSRSEREELAALIKAARILEDRFRALLSDPCFAECLRNIQAPPGVNVRTGIGGGQPTDGAAGAGQPAQGGGGAQVTPPQGGKGLAG